MGILGALVLFTAAATSVTEVSFPIGLGEEVFEINCSTNPSRIRGMREGIARQEREMLRLRLLQQKNELVEGENLLLLTLQFKVGFERQNLAVVEFGQYYCLNPNQIPSLKEVNIEDIIMRSSS